MENEQITAPVEAQTIPDAPPAGGQQDTPETTPAPAGESEPQTEQGALAEDAVGIDENGEMAFGEKFFGDFLPVDEPEPDAEPEQTSAEPDGTVPAEPAKIPSMAEYAPEEVQALPFEQIDRARLPEAVKAYLPALDAYHQRHLRELQQLRQYAQTLEAQVRQQQPGTSPTPQQGQPQRYIDGLTVLDPKQITERARALAAERLKVRPEDIDSYDTEHIAALTTAVTELAASNRENVTKRDQYERDRKDFDIFTAQVQALPDFQEFNAHIEANLSRQGYRPQDVMAHVAQTGDIRGFMSSLYAAYQQFRQSKAASAKAPTPQVAGQAQRPAVPKLERGGGNAVPVQKQIDWKRFREMDDDERTKTLIEAGYAG